MTDKNEVLELEKFGAVVDYRGYYAAFPTKKSLDAFAAALEEKQQAQIAMLRKALLLLEPSGDFTSYENADGEKIGMFLNAALSATQQSSDAFLAEVRAKAKIGLLRGMIEDLRGTDCSYYPMDLQAIIAVLEDDQLRNSAAQPEEKKVK